MDDNTQVPTYGLLVINHAYNEGKITFRQWLELSRKWAEAMLRRNDEGDQDSDSTPEPPSRQ